MQTTSQSSPPAPLKTNWAHVALFLGLTFGLSWLADLVMYLNGGLTNPATTLILQFRMLLPAFSAMFLGVFFFKKSLIYYLTNRTTSRWFIYFYFLLTFLYLIGAIAGLMQPDKVVNFSSLLLVPNLLGLILLIVLRLLKGGKDVFAGAGLSGGKVRVWFLYGLGLIAFYGLQTFLNYVFKLGQVVDLKTAFPQLAANLPVVAIMPIMAFNMVITGPFLGLIISFGEEYGWRGYLQTELTRLGRIRGVFLLGVIWGVWHWPVIWMGYNFPGQPVLGSIAMVAVCIILSYFLAHAVFKSNGVWTAAYLHALSNQTLSFFVLTMIMPTNILFSFGMGLPSLALGAIIVLLLLRDPVWKEK